MEVMTRNDVTVRIDTDLREKARTLDINMSRLLEDSLRDEIERQETRAATAAAGESEEIRLELEDTDGRPYVGKITGKLLGEARDVFVYLTDDERVIVYDANRPAYQEIDDPAELAGWFRHDLDVYAEVLHALGEKPEVDL